MKKSKVEHTTIRNQNLFCLNCGGEYKLQYPLPIIGMDSFESKVEQFNKLHKSCKPTWKEPIADQNKTANEKALWWLQNGERGMSSEAMCFCLMGQSGGRNSHPRDPDDFKRCYKLLQAVPEWRNQLYKLQSLSPVWSKLVDNWDKLTEFYEDMMKVKKANGMYEFMNSLGC